MFDNLTVSNYNEDMQRSLVILGLILMVGFVVLFDRIFRNSVPETNSELMKDGQKGVPVISEKPLVWEKYQSSDYKFELEYPAGWQVGEVEKEATIPADRYIYFRPVAVKTENPIYGAIQLSIYKKSLDIDKFIEKYICLTPDNCASAKDAKEIMVGGVKGKWMERPPGPVPAQAVSFKNGDTIYNLAVVLSDSPQQGVFWERKEIFERVLKSFQFIKKN